MTFPELLEKSASDLEAMSDAQLLEYLGSCLKDCPPIDILIVEAEENKLKEEKARKKEEKKLEKKLAKNSSEDPIVLSKALTMKQQIEMMMKNLQHQMDKKKG